jgi:hypothetical protein
MQYDMDQCGGTSMGTLKLRDQSGYWFEWEKEACRDCGIVSWEGFEVGKICVGTSLDNAIISLINSSRVWMEGG